MERLHDIGLKGQLPNFISNFLSDRSFNVRIGSTVPDTFEQEQGVPHGSILSLLFLISKLITILRFLTFIKCTFYKPHPLVQANVLMSWDSFFYLNCARPQVIIHDISIFCIRQ